jgi:hypothetical protein
MVWHVRFIRPLYRCRIQGNARRPESDVSNPFKHRSHPSFRLRYSYHRRAEGMHSTHRLACAQIKVDSQTDYSTFIELFRHRIQQSTFRPKNHTCWHTDRVIAVTLFTHYWTCWTQCARYHYATCSVNLLIVVSKNLTKNKSQITTKLDNTALPCYKIKEINYITIQGNQLHQTLLNCGLDLH